MSKTRNISTRYVVEVYPFHNTLPNPDDFDSYSPIPSFILGSAVEIDATKEALKNSFTSGLVPATYFGLKSLRATRTKTNPDSQCNMEYVGPLPDGLIPGTWIVVSSIGAVDTTGAKRRLVRYIGQIHTITPNFSSNPETGLISTVTEISCREWSASLTIPIRYDHYSLQNTLIQTIKGPAAVALGTGEMIDDLVRAGRTPKQARKEITEITKKAFDAFSACHLILRMVGAMANNDANDKAKNLETNAPKYSMAPPRVPFQLMKRLGLMNTDLNNFGEDTHPFTSGFVKVLTGIQLKPFGNAAKGKWNGFFNKDNSIKNYGELLRKGKESKKYAQVASGILAMSQVGMSAWDLLTQYCDNAVNEVFTDLLYEIQSDETEDLLDNIKTQPVIFIRDKPFLMKYWEKSSLRAGSKVFGNWTYYDDIPRVNINASSIMNVQFRNTFLNSPNYIRTNVSLPVTNKDVSSALSAIDGFVRMLPEQHRFGGQEFFLETQFIEDKLTESSGPDFTPSGVLQQGGLSSNTQTTTWFKEMRDVSRFWHGYRYRMADATITLKDDNYAIMIGFNATFRIGKYAQLVGHVDSISFSFDIDPNGLEQNVTQVSLRRVVRVKSKKDEELAFVDANDWGKIPFMGTPTPDELDDSGTGPSSALNDLLGG